MISAYTIRLCTTSFNEKSVPAGVHWDEVALERLDQTLLPSDKARRGLRPLLDRPSLPLPDPDNPWLLETCKLFPEDTAGASDVLLLGTSVTGDRARIEFDIDGALVSPPKERLLFAKESPVVGIFRFFLLLVFSKDS